MENIQGLTLFNQRINTGHYLNLKCTLRWT